MAFDLPTLEGLSQSLRQAVPTYFKRARADFWPNNLTIIGKMIALACYEALLRVRWVYRQIFISTCSEAHLVVHGSELGIARRPALAASGTISLEATAPFSLPAGALFVSDAGEFYLAPSAIVGGAGAVSIPVIAQNAGVVGNAPAGIAVRLVVPVAGVPEGTLPYGAAGGSDIEDIEAYRARILERLRARPRGGNDDDYRVWVKESGNFDAVFIKGWHPSAGRVTIYPLKPGKGAARIPSAPELAALAEKLERLRPLCAEIVLAQASIVEIPVVISGLSGDTEDVRREIYAELADMFEERAFVALPGESATFSRSWLYEAISRAVGEQRHILVSPAVDVPLAPGSLPVLGSIGYQ